MALAAIVAFPRRAWAAWAGVLLGAFATQLTRDAGVVTGLGVALSQALAVGVGGWFLTRVAHFAPAMDRLRDVIAFVVVMLGVPSISVTLGLMVMAAGGAAPTGAFGEIWTTLWAWELLWLLVVFPFVTAWTSRSQMRWEGARRVEMLLMLALLVPLAHATMTNAATPDAVQYQTHRASVVLLIWAALRFGPRETALVLFVITVEALAGATRGVGPFIVGSPAHHVALIEMFVAFIGVTAYAVTAAMCQRRIAEQQLLAAHHELEQRVLDRTAELEAANAELRLTTAAMAEKNQELESFVHNVSHDLRAPIHNLRGFCGELTLASEALAEVARDPELPVGVAERLRLVIAEDVVTSLNYVASSADRLQRLVDALIRLSRHGRHPMHVEPVDARAVVAAATEGLRGTIGERGATIEVGELPWVLGDAAALERVLANVVGNALAYLDPTRPGRIEIGATLIDVPDPVHGRDAGMVRMWVRDNGRGIPAREHAKLFQVFQRFHPTVAPGEGIGLAIVKRIIERSGGRVWAESEEGVGSTFCWTLPAFAPTAESRAPRDATGGAHEAGRT